MAITVSDWMSETGCERCERPQLQGCWFTIPGFSQGYTIWFFNIAMENRPNKWRFLAGKIIYNWVIYTMAVLVITRGYSSFYHWKIHRLGNLYWLVVYLPL